MDTASKSVWQASGWEDKKKRNTKRMRRIPKIPKIRQNLPYNSPLHFQSHWSLGNWEVSLPSSLYHLNVWIHRGTVCLSCHLHSVGAGRRRCRKATSLRLVPWSAAILKHDQSHEQPPGEGQYLLERKKERNIHLSTMIPSKQVTDFMTEPWTILWTDSFKATDSFRYKTSDWLYERVL